MGSIAVAVLLVSLACLVVVVAAVMVAGGKEDCGCEYYGDYFIAYVYTNKLYTAHIHKAECKTHLDVLRHHNMLELQKMVKSWADRKRG